MAIGDDKDMLKKAFTQSILMDFSHIETRSQTTEETETTSVRRRKRSETMEEFWKKNEARFPAACSQFTFREDDPKENYIRQIEVSLASVIRCAFFNAVFNRKPSNSIIRRRRN